MRRFERGALWNLLIASPATPKGKSEGGWDSIHVFESIDRGRLAHYKLTSTVILRLSTANEALGDMDLSGNMTRQTEQDMPVTDDASHVVNIGKTIEDMELKMRNLLRAYISFFCVPQLPFPYLRREEKIIIPVLTIRRGSVFR